MFGNRDILGKCLEEGVLGLVLWPRNNVTDS